LLPLYDPRSSHSERPRRTALYHPTDATTRLFVLIEIVSFFTQAAGGGLQASKNFNKKTAEYIILGGLILQILGFGLFSATALIWHVRMKQSHTGASRMGNTWIWQRIMAMLYAVSAFIMVRSVFRVIEYVMGTDGYLLRHEWSLYVFDAVLMLLTVGVFTWRYPGQLSVTLVAGTELETGSDIELGNGNTIKNKRLSGSRR
jgi:hypothetical protein